MFSSLTLFLILEIIQPSYGTFLNILPAQNIVAPAEKSIRATRKKTESIEPVIEAKSVYALDLTIGTPFLTRDIFSRRPIASIEKLLTAMVILENHSLKEKVIISKTAANQEGSTMGLQPGEEITVENLLTGMLINSGNDAAVALAEFDSKSETAFVQKLNAKTFSLGLYDTHFSNAKGFDEKENYSTAFDTMIFSRAALDYPFIRTIVGIKNTEVTSTNEKIKHVLENTNELLADPHFNILGVKTGTSPAAGQSVVSLLKTPQNHEILTVVLSSPDRFQETKIILDWVLRNFEFQ